jgi:hypothetical protein
MRRLLLLCTLTAALAARAEGFGAEVGAGPAYGAAAARDGFAPAFSLRASYQWSFFSAGIRGLLFAGSEASTKGSGSQLDSSGFQAWAALAEASIATPGTISVGLRLAGGLGKVIGLNCDCEEVAALRGHVAPAFLGSAFTSAQFGDHARVSLELAGVHFSDLENGQAPFSAPATGLEAWSFVLLLSVQWVQR